MEITKMGVFFKRSCYFFKLIEKPPHDFSKQALPNRLLLKFAAILCRKYST